MTSNRKLPAGDEPFEHFLAQGPNRTFLAVAKHWEVDPAQVTRRARRERWLERLAPVEQQLAVKTQDAIVETLAQMRLRHAQVARGLIERGLEALERFEIVEVKDAIKALELGIKMERDARELPSKTVSVEVTHELRERLIPAQVAKPRRRLEAAVVDDIEDLLTDEEKASIMEEGDDE